jgi:hypothetical protein
MRQCWCRDVNICKTLVVFWPVEVQQDRFRQSRVWNWSSRREGILFATRVEARGGSKGHGESSHVWFSTSVGRTFWDRIQVHPDLRFSMLLDVGVIAGLLRVVIGGKMNCMSAS